MINSTNIYNPEGSALRRDQHELLQMLLIVSEICKENGITWWLSSGTLLGAARHQGFIPWDDDMDIVLLKKDYKKLERILIDLESDVFVFHCQKTDIDYVNEFGKFRKKIGRIQSKSNRYRYYRWTGIGFDIFAIERTNLISAVLADYITKFFNRLSYKVDVRVVRHAIIRCSRFLLHYLFYPILSLIGLCNPRKEYHYTLGTGWPKHTFFLSDTFPLSSAVFEGLLMPVPHDCDAYLSNVYGNWREPPTNEAILASIHCEEYKQEIEERIRGYLE